MTPYTNIIDHVFSSATGLLRINTLDIDLGDIQAADISSMDVLSRFQEILQQKINSLAVDDSRQLPGANNKQELQLATQLQQEAGLLEVVMTSGDIPWWADKSDRPDIDAIVKKMMHTNPQVLSNLLQQQLHRPELLLRLFAYLKPATLSAIEERMPAVSRVLLKERIIEQSLHSGSRSASPGTHTSTASIKQHPPTGTASIPLQTEKASIVQGLLQHIKKIVIEQQETIPALRSLLPERLMQFLKSMQVRKLSAKEIPLENVLVNLGLQKNTYLSNAPIHKKDLAMALDSLQEFEAALLLLALNNYLDTTVFTPEADRPDQEKHQLPMGDMGEGFSAPEKNADAEKIAGTEKKKIQPSPHDEAATRYNNIPKSDQAALPGNKTADKKDSTAKNESLPVNESIQQEQYHSETDRQQASKPDPEKNIRATNQKPLANSDNDIPDKKQNDKLDRRQTDRKNKMIAFIAARLRVSRGRWLPYLQELDEALLEKLAYVFEKKQEQYTAVKHMVDELCEHPAFLQKNILKIFTQLAKHISNESQHAVLLPPDKKNTGKENDPLFTTIPVAPSAASLLAFIRKMPAQEYFIIKDIIDKKRFDTRDEKKLMKKILTKLPMQDVAVLKFLVELAPAQLDQLAPLAAAIPATGEQANKPDTPFNTGTDQHGIHVENAGLCLLAAYLPAFFKELGYLQDGQFKTKLAAIRAVYLLQWMASGKMARPEYLLQLNKILCGMDATEMAFQPIRLTKKERQEADQLISAVIGNWRAVKNTSVNGFRDSFLQRKGIIAESDQVWTVRVEKKGFDVLLNTIPWSFRLIKLPWMKKMLEVEW